MSESLVLLARNDAGIATITLNDPPALNAMSAAMATQFRDTVAGLEKDDDLRVVIVTGAGTAFSAGGHREMLEALPNNSKEENHQKMEWFYGSFLSVRNLSVPVIAAINGHAVGAGMAMTLACDIRVAQLCARLGFNFVRLGLHPGMASTFYLPRLVGPGRAAELLCTGTLIDADRAAEIGLVNEVVDSDHFQGRVDELAQQIASAGPVAVRELKATLQQSAGYKLEQAIAREATRQAEAYAGAEFAEGLAASLEKRTAKF